MLRYENKGNCIEVLLPNSDYSVFAVYATTSTTDKINVTLNCQLALASIVPKKLKLCCHHKLSLFVIIAPKTPPIMTKTIKLVSNIRLSAIAKLINK